MKTRVFKNIPLSKPKPRLVRMSPNDDLKR